MVYIAAVWLAQRQPGLTRAVDRALRLRDTEQFEARSRLAMLAAIADLIAAAGVIASPLFLTFGLRN